ncbi:MAG: hypothetical protein GOMPHAMPRED_005624 [Gomphillus americanus]|uniref:Casein kinase II subunit beta n=1 Tax=Gomphillus americanus TaxID=1940652 RepID=A0A8H3FT13_9LECA|nr:MAG: hypothetical protein GOMPHAMPRED_005624 [Gomphillus americanus]
MSSFTESDPLDTVTWINSFCSLLGHEYFAEVSEEFIEDDFNLTGLQSQVPMYKDALEMILDVEPDSDMDPEPDEEDMDDDEEDVMRDEEGYRIDAHGFRLPRGRSISDQSIIESSAELLYGLIHQRFITSRPGIQQMAEKYEAQHFGHCPRVFCNSTKVLPVGIYDTPGIDTVKLFCSSCMDVYTPPNSRFQSVDGAFFGTTFGCLFFMTFPDFQITPQGDPLNLASTHPIYSNTPYVVLREPATVTRRDSRSSSLTSASAPTVPSVPQIPAEWIPPSNQPTTINGTSTGNLAPGLGPGRIHEPKIYGFRVSERAKTGPRMKWLRMRPVDITELDEVGRLGNDRDEDMGDQDATTIKTGKNGTKTATAGQRKKAAAKSRRNLPAADGANGTGQTAS